MDIEMRYMKAKSCKDGNHDTLRTGHILLEHTRNWDIFEEL